MNILLTGFYGEGNLGDEAILRAICENLPSEITPIITSGTKQSFGKSIKRRGLFSWPSFLKAAASSPITVFSGGILQDWSWEGVSFFALRIIAAAKMGSQPVLYGAGIGPLRSEKARNLTKKALSLVRQAYVRDKTSLELYKELLPNANVKLGTDWTWHFPINKTNKKSEHNTLGINLRQWLDSDLLQSTIKEIKDFDGSKKGLAARSGDIKLISEISDPNSVVCPGSFEEFATSCNGLTHGIAMRYHAALAMLRCGIPTKLVCYDNKVKDLARQLGMELNESGISLNFNAPSSDFFTNNEKLYSEMKISFQNLLKCNYEHY